LGLGYGARARVRVRVRVRARVKARKGAGTSGGLARAGEVGVGGLVGDAAASRLGERVQPLVGAVDRAAWLG